MQVKRISVHGEFQVSIDTVVPFLTLCHWQRLENIVLSRITTSGAAALAAGSVHWPALHTLHCSAQLSTAFFRTLAVGSWPSLERLELSGSDFYDPAPEAGAALAAFLANLPSLKHLDLGLLSSNTNGNSILLRDSLSLDLPIECLELNHCEMDVDFARQLADAVPRRWPNLHTLAFQSHYHRSRIEGVDYDRMACELVRIPTLKTLRLLTMHIGSDSENDNVQFRLGMVSPSIEKLTMFKNGFNSTTMSRIFEGDWRFAQLKDIHLDYNDVGEGVAQLLAQASADGRLPAVENVSVHSLGTKGVSAFFSAPWKRLKTFSLRLEDGRPDRDQVGLVGAGALGNAAAQGFLPSLISLSLGNCKLNARMLGLMFSKGPWPSLLDLRLSKNPFSDHGCRILARYAHNLPVLRVLDVADCKIGDAGLAEITSAFESLSLDVVDVTVDENLSPTLSSDARREWYEMYVLLLPRKLICRKVQGRMIPRDDLQGRRVPCLDGEIMAPLYKRRFGR